MSLMSQVSLVSLTSLVSLMSLASMIVFPLASLAQFDTRCCVVNRVYNPSIT